MLTGKYRPNQPRVPPIACRRRWHPAPPLQAARGGKGCQTSPLSSGEEYASRSKYQSACRYQEINERISMIKNNHYPKEDR